MESRSRKEEEEHSEELHNLISSINTRSITMTKSRIRYVGHIARVVDV
jgi:hypothetical protein